LLSWSEYPQQKGKREQINKLYSRQESLGKKLVEWIQGLERIEDEFWKEE